MNPEAPLDQLGKSIEEASGVDAGATGRQERIDITKEALRQVIKEWLDERYRDVGRWSLRGILLLGFAALAYFILTHTGWSRP